MKSWVLNHEDTVGAIEIRVAMRKCAALATPAEAASMKLTLSGTASAQAELVVLLGVDMNLKP